MFVCFLGIHITERKFLCFSELHIEEILDLYKAFEIFVLKIYIKRRIMWLIVIEIYITRKHIMGCVCHIFVVCSWNKYY